jgi:hypothetical protein
MSPPWPMCSTMIIKKSLPSGCTIFCDDLRQETSGKITIVGAYSGGMQITGEMPVIIPRFSAMIMLWLDPDTSRKDVLLKILYETDEGEESEVFSKPLQVGKENVTNPMPKKRPDHLEIRAMIQLGNVEIDRAGRFKARIYDGDDEIRVGTLRVLLVGEEGTGAVPKRLPKRPRPAKRGDSLPG